MDKLKKLEEKYRNIPIPENLDAVVEASLKKGRKKRAPKWLLGVAAAAALFTASVNMSPTMARALVDVPVLGSVVEVLTFVHYETEEDTYSANIDVPKITGSSDEINALNQKYAAEGKALYEQFQQDMKGMEQANGGHLGVDSGYVVATDTEQLLSIGRYVVETVGSSSTVMHYDTIDKQKEIVLTLPSLFKDDRYVSVISDYVIGQMREEMLASNQEKVYWIKGGGIPDEEVFYAFTTIKPDQNFYITADNKLVVVFDKYEVAPGYMGIVEFEIPTELLKDMLMSEEYIQ
ncbi:RsiV family protein [Lysinibacillus sp. KU-BSD001]|uniref:RsiV family protein n=1 Tax=Lysinibacillus sp. KU-BSD001 TaxID=3141328 RepID=UPI0036EF3443